jgi:hypothetical protein
MSNIYEEGQGSQRAVVPMIMTVMMMMMMMMMMLALLAHLRVHHYPQFHLFHESVLFN